MNFRFFVTGWVFKVLLPSKRASTFSHSPESKRKKCVKLISSSSSSMGCRCRVRIYCKLILFMVLYRYSHFANSTYTPRRWRGNYITLINFTQ